MKNLRYSGIALLLGVWYLNDGKDKGPFTLTVEISLIVIRCDWYGVGYVFDVAQET